MTIKPTSVVWTALATLALGAACAGCSPESKAKSTLGKYESVFAMCKQMTEEAKLPPGGHRCSKVSSMAVEMSLKDSGLPDTEWQKMLAAWLKEKGYEAYYLDPSKNRHD